MSQPFRLVRNSLSFDTDDCLHHLIKAAERGEIIGLAYAAMYRERTYHVDACGEARKSIAFARGMVGDLDDELRAIRDDTARSET